jgi:hypothetical protein
VEVEAVMKVEVEVDVEAEKGVEAEVETEVEVDVETKENALAVFPIADKWSATSVDCSCQSERQPHTSVVVGYRQ